MTFIGHKLWFCSYHLQGFNTGRSTRDLVQQNTIHEAKSSLSKNKRRIIYKVIENDYFDKNKIFPRAFFHFCKYRYIEPGCIMESIKKIFESPGFEQSVFSRLKI